MKYFTIYYNESDQKLARRKPTIKLENENYHFLGTMTGVEMDFLVECLSDRFGDQNISLKQIQRYFTQTRTFADNIKKIISDE